MFNDCRSENFDAVERLVKSDNINLTNKNGDSPLIIACDHNRKKIVNFLIEKGANIIHRNNDNESALDIVRNKENEDYHEIETMLIDSGADSNIPKEDGDTLLTSACKREDLEEVKKLIKHGFNIDAKNRNGDTPLIIACKYGNKNIINYLISKGANLLNKGEYEISALMSACYFINDEIISKLIKNGCNCEEKDEDGNTSLMIAFQ